MLPNQKSKADFVSVDSCPEIPESKARGIIYDAFTALTASSNRGLSASKHAPQNQKETNETQLHKVGGTRDKGRGLESSKHAPKNTEKIKENYHNTFNRKNEQGLNASKHAPHMVNRTNQNQRSRGNEARNKDNGLNLSRHAPKNSRQTPDTRRPNLNVLDSKDGGFNASKDPSSNLGKASEAQRNVNNTQTKYQSTETTMAPPINVDDTSAFLAAMNRNLNPAATIFGVGESKHGTSLSVKSEGEFMEGARFYTYSQDHITFYIRHCLCLYLIFLSLDTRYIHPLSWYNLLTKYHIGNASNVSSSDNSPEAQEASAGVPEVPAGATRVIKITGVCMDHGMNWLYQRARDGGQEVAKVFDTFTPGGVSIYFISTSLCYSVFH